MGAQERRVAEVRIHPEFPRDRNSRNDFDDKTRAGNQDNIAILIMKENFDLTPQVNKICLPTSANSYKKKSCFATGWGKDSVNGTYQQVMKQVELKLWPDDKCQSALAVATKQEFFRLDQSWLCAGGNPDEPGADTCNGDGGGPIMCPTDKYFKDYKGESIPIYEQAGITNFGLGCGRTDVPAVYTDVVYEMCFITWSAKCVKGEDAFSEYDYNCGKDWGADQMNKYQKIIDDLESKQSGLTEGSRPWKRVQRDLKKNRIV